MDTKECCCDTHTHTRTQKTLRLEGKPKIESVKSVDLIWIYFYHIFEIGQLSWYRYEPYQLKLRFCKRVKENLRSHENLICSPYRFEQISFENISTWNPFFDYLKTNTICNVLSRFQRQTKIAEIKYKIKIE